MGRCEHCYVCWCVFTYPAAAVLLSSQNGLHIPIGGLAFGDPRLTLLVGANASKHRIPWSFHPSPIWLQKAGPESEQTNKKVRS